VRVFLGIALDGPVVTTIERACAAIRDVSPAWREEKWVPAENLHITVRFLGEVPETGVPDLSALMTEVTSRYPVHEIALSGVVARPRVRSAKMLWARFGGDMKTTVALAEALSDALAGVGYRRPEYPFAAHATLVRSRHPKTIGEEPLASARAIIETSTPTERTMSVAGVTLFSSTLTPRGPRYRSLGVAGLVQD